MTVSSEYAADWQIWHDNRVKHLTRPHGYLSVVSQDWLYPGEPFTSEFVPGQWLLEDGEIYYLPDQQLTAAGGDSLIVDGQAVTTKTHIPHGHNRNAGTGSAVSMFYKDLELETLTRVNAEGEKIYAVRVRDPQEAARRLFDDITTFPLSDEWIVPAKFTPTEVSVDDVATVEASILETTYTIGRLELTIDRESYSLSVLAHRAGSEETGYFRDLTYVHIGDQTNGVESYGGGRYVALDPDHLENITELDLNRLVSFSCAFSTFAACAPTPPGNRLPFRVPAGEHTPPVDFERIATYTPSH